MKILILGFSKIKYMPYMNFYLENIDPEANEVHLLYWNRDLKKEDTSSLQGVKLHEFRRAQKDDVSKISKVGSFIGYRKYAKHLIKKEKFDFIIFLHSLPGVLLSDILVKKYPDKFIFDYRDSTYEHFKPFKNVIAKLVKASKATFVSSDAFRQFLPESEKDKIFTSHNLLTDSLSHRDEKIKHGIPSDKIRIAFWGFIRHEDVNREIIRKIAADDRLELHYYGREQQIAQNLKGYVSEINAQNVFFHGEYKPEDRYQFVRNTDIIHNIYKDNNTMLAMGNKFYDGLIFYLPQLCLKGSFMGGKCTEAGVGLECDLSDFKLTDQIFTYYQNIEWDLFRAKCDRELNLILEEVEEGKKALKKAVN